jgi:hypothetical protein
VTEARLVLVAVTSPVPRGEVEFVASVATLALALSLCSLVHARRAEDGNYM